MLLRRRLGPTLSLAFVAALAGCGGPELIEDAGVVVHGDGGLVSADAGSTLPGPPDAGRTGWPDCPWVEPVAPPCTGQSILEKLACVPGLQVTGSSPSGPVPSTITITFTQPVDHLHPDAGTFAQVVLLRHVGVDHPLVLSTTGYDLYSYELSEPAVLANANELMVEHRYFGASVPAPLDWSALTIRNAAADFHRLRDALKWIYPARWVSTGISKGGMTVVQHRRFYPCDVDGTVAYSAPQSYGEADIGYSGFLDDVGGVGWASCRQSLKDAQRAMLTRRAELIPLMPNDFTLAGGKARVLEHAVLELGFAFWQYTSPANPSHGCAAIPGTAAPAAALYAFLDWHVQLEGYFGDDGFRRFMPYYYQAATQLGGPAPYETPVSGLLLYPGTYEARTYAPSGVPLVFDPLPMIDLQQWVVSSGARLLFVYGEFDPWGARRFALGGATDSAVVEVPGGNHGAQLWDLPPSQRAAAEAIVRRWLGRP